MQTSVGKRELGTAYPTEPLLIEQPPTGRGRSFVEFRLPLSPQQLAALEDHRNAGDLDFDLALVGHFGIRGQPPYQHKTAGNLRAKAAESDWVKHLQGASACEILLLEVSFPLPLSGHAKTIRTHLLRAHQQYVEGDYEGCVLSCRKVTDTLPQLSSFLWSDLTDKTQRENLIKEKRQGAIQKTVTLYTHLSAHPSTETITRADARLILTCVTALASHTATTP